ncbi:MAG: hypothetical protein N2745_09130 [Syntrophorhabdaceae bacterium]|nr:hypothetical protein [Syntrophorhabdaceae bacterium]
MDNRGKAGCGCLIFILVASMVVVAVLFHPFTLKIISGQLIYEDKIYPADAIFVPRFFEDKNGEVYIDAFREYWAGNGNLIWVEEDRVLGVSLSEIIMKNASARGIKEGVIKRLEVNGEGTSRVKKIKEAFSKAGIKKVIVVVPEYASRRFHMWFGSDNGRTVYLIKPVHVSYFKRDRWWKEAVSREMLFKEVTYMASYGLERFKYGEKEDPQRR